MPVGTATANTRMKQKIAEAQRKAGLSALRLCDLLFKQAGGYRSMTVNLLLG